MCAARSMMHEHVRMNRSSGGQIAVAFRHLRLVTCSPDLSVTCGHLDAVDGKVRKHSKEATRALELVSAELRTRRAAPGWMDTSSFRRGAEAHETAVLASVEHGELLESEKMDGR